MTKRVKVSIVDAIHPARRKAILILETLAEHLDKPKIFDKAWYKHEDALTEIINRK